MTEKAKSCFNETIEYLTENNKIKLAVFIRGIYTRALDIEKDISKGRITDAKGHSYKITKEK